MGGFDGLFKSLGVSGSALSAQRFNMGVISGNLANSEVDSRNNWSPYHRRVVTFESVLDRSLGRGDAAFRAINACAVRARVRVDSSRGDLVKAPDGMKPGQTGVYENGMIEKSNVDVSQEMVRLLEASRAYEANVAAVKAFREMVGRALSIGR